MKTPGGLFVATLIVAGFAGLVTGAQVAHAQPRAATDQRADQRARDLFVRGDAAYAEGRYEEALSAFEEAYALSERPQLLFNVSNALERLGRYAEAIEALEKYIASGKARDHEIVQKRLANLKKRVEEQKRENDRVAKEEEEKRQRELEEKQRAEALAAAPPRPRPAPPVKAPDKPSLVPPILVLGAGAAALATGAVFGGLTLSARSEVESDCSDGRPGGRLCQGDARSPLDREKTFGVVADVALISGVVLGIVGTYWLLTVTNSRDKARAAVHGRGVDFALSF